MCPRAGVDFWAFAQNALGAIGRTAPHMDLSNPTTIAIIIAGVIILAIAIFMYVKQKTTFNRLEKMLEDEDYDGFFKLVDSKLTHLLFPEYNLTYFKLNAYLNMGDDENVDKILDDLLSRNLPEEQRQDLVIKAFTIYLQREDKEKTRELLKEIESWNSEKYRQTTHECRRLYDIVILEKANHIDEMERELGASEGKERGRLEYFIALQYHNKGDEENYQKYYELAIRHSFDYEIRSDEEIAAAAAAAEVEEHEQPAGEAAAEGEVAAADDQAETADSAAAEEQPEDAEDEPETDDAEGAEGEAAKVEDEAADEAEA